MIPPAKAFEALAHETRLAVFRLLIPAGTDTTTLRPAPRVARETPFL